MRIPPYWAKESYEGRDSAGQAQSFVACGWSFSSLQEAKDEAIARAKRVFELVTRGQKPDSYEYLDRPIKEERVGDIGEHANPIAVITRNRYGALVLNTSQVLFADVDFPPPPSRGLVDSLLALFSPKRREAKRRAVIAETIGRVESWAKENPARGFRLYRTREGLRLLFTDKLYEPKSDETAAILSGVQADPMYVRLTQAQECFRARLTAKPWRCGCTRPPASFPWANAKAEDAFRKWEREYTQTDASYRACEFVRQIGRAAGIAEIETVATAHDREARVASDTPLA